MSEKGAFALVLLTDPHINKDFHSYHEQENQNTHIFGVPAKKSSTEIIGLVASFTYN